MDRRTFVKVAGMASVAATAGMAGCQGGGDDGSTDDSPSDGSISGGATARYNQWLYADAVEGSESFAVSLDWETASNQQSSQSTASSDESLRDDALAITPISWLFVGALSVGFGLSQLGLNSAVEEGGPTEYVHVASGGIIIEGSYDTESLATSIEQAGASQVEEYNGYTLYQQSGTQGTAIGLSSETVVVVQGSGENVSDPLARVKGIIDAGAGERTLLSEDSESFNDVANALPNRSVMGAAHRPEPEPLNSSSGEEGGDTGLSQTDLDGEVDAIATSADVSQGSMTSAMAIRYTSEGEVNAKADIEAAIGSQASNQSVTIDGPLVVIEGEYDALPSLSSS